MLFVSHKKKQKPQVLTFGSISLQEDRGHDKKQVAKTMPPPVMPKKTTQQNARTPPRNDENTTVSAQPPLQPPPELPVPPSKEPTLPTPTETSVIPPAQVALADAASPSTATFSSSSTTNSKPVKQRRHVRFHSVELQEYSVTVGDHPLCKGYFPLTLDWCHARPKAFGINDYEARKEQHRRSHSEPWHLNTRERWERLRLVTGMNEFALAQLEQIRRGQ